VLLEDHISRIHPKVAIFLVGANDLARGPGVEFDAENVKSSISFQSPTAFVKSLSPYSEVAALAANLYRSLNAYQQGLLHQKVDLRQQGYFDPPPAVRSDYFAETANPSFLQGYEARLRRILAICKDNHITPILATQPLLGGPAIDDATGIDLARVRANPRANGEMWWESLEAYNDVTRRVGRESGVLVVDVAHEMPKSSRFFYDFVHFTAAGAQQVAGILYAHVCPALSADFPGYFAAGSCGAASSGR
jgi:lysophospholipase L1-like esterase